MKLCMSTMCIDNASVEDKIKSIAQAGFDSIEIWLKDFNNTLEIKKIIKGEGIRVAETVKIEGWFELDGSLMGVKDHWDSIFDECKKRMDITKELGSKYIVALPSRSDRGKFSSMGDGIERYMKILEYGKTIDVCPTLEFIGQSKQINNIDSALNFLKLVNDSYCKLIVDVFHIWRSGDEIEDSKKIPIESISLLHLHDATADHHRSEYKDRHRVMPGDGILNLKEFIEIFNKKGFTGDVSLGVYNHDNWNRDPYEVAIEGFFKMKKIMEKENL